MKREKVIDTIRKLLNLSEGTNSPAEAEAAAAKAQQLLLKYNLAMADVNAHITEDEKLIGQEIFESGENKNESNWIVQLYGGIARYNFCRIVFHRSKQLYSTNIAVIGRKGNVEAVHYMVEILVPQIRKMAKAAWNEYGGREKRGKFTRGFLVGCAHGIETKLYNEWAQMQVSDVNVRALVVKSGAELDNFVRQRYPILGKGRQRSLSSWEGRQVGDRAGQGMNIRRGITGDNKFGGYLE